MYVKIKQKHWFQCFFVNFYNLAKKKLQKVQTNVGWFSLAN